MIFELDSIDPADDSAAQENSAARASASSENDARTVRRRKTDESRRTRPISDALLRRFTRYSGRLSTEAVHWLETQLPFFQVLPADQKAQIHLIIQSAIRDFAAWTKNPEAELSDTIAAFKLLPGESGSSLRSRKRFSSFVRRSTTSNWFFRGSRTTRVSAMPRSRHYFDTAVNSGSPPPPSMQPRPRTEGPGIPEWKRCSSTRSFAETIWPTSTPARRRSTGTRLSR